MSTSIFNDILACYVKNNNNKFSSKDELIFPSYKTNRNNNVETVTVITDSGATDILVKQKDKDILVDITPSTEMTVSVQMDPAEYKRMLAQ